MLAAKKGRDEVIPLLLEAGAVVDMPTKVGMGGAELESYPGSMVMTMNPARSRLMLWPFPLSPQQGGWTALIAGALKGHAQVVEMLLGAGANTDLQTNVRDSTTTPPSLSPNPRPRRTTDLTRPCAHTLPSVSPTGRIHGLDKRV